MTSQLRETPNTHNPAVPLPKGHRLYLNTTGQAYFFKYVTAPTSNSISGLQEHEDVIGGLSRLDADCNLGKAIRKKGRFLHSIIEVRRLR